MEGIDSVCNLRVGRREERAESETCVSKCVTKRETSRIKRAID